MPNTKPQASVYWTKVHGLAVEARGISKLTARVRIEITFTPRRANDQRLLRDGAAMIDFLLERVFGPIIVVAAVVFLLFLVVVCPLVAIFGGPSTEQQMYQHCIDDGNKDYVCYQMMQRVVQTRIGSMLMPVPMPMPMRTK